MQEKWLEFKKFTPFLGQVIRRDFKRKYKGSFLGVAWNVLQPLAAMLVITIVFSAVFKRDIPNFPVYLICGQIVYDFFAESTRAAMASIVRNPMMICRVYIPRYMLPLSSVTIAFINTCFSFFTLFIVMLATHLRPSYTALLFFIPLGLTFFFSYGLGLLLSACAVFFRDLTNLYDIFLQILRYATPIFYPATIYPAAIAPILKANPLYHLVTMFRDVIMYHSAPSQTSVFYCLAWCASMLIIGVVIFQKTERSFALYI